MGGSGSILRKKSGDLSSIKSMSELQTYARSKGILLRDNTEDMDMDTLKEGIAQIERLQSEIPLLAQNDVFIKAEELRSGAYGNATPSTNFNSTVIKINSNYFAADKIESGRKNYNGDIQSSFHPKGTNLSSTLAHEYGHYIESQIIQKTNSTTVERVASWNKSKAATKIVRSASVKAKKTEYGKDKSIDQLVSSISRYALKSRSEALAEAVADYAKNGSKANPMSKAIWQEVKSILK